jgi:4-hydroxymandelate oxidase
MLTRCCLTAASAAERTSSRRSRSALALGADAVLVGRLQMYALSVAGPLGVAHMIKLLREELEVCMALAGCATLHDIDAGALLRDH